ncbi:MAG TPA: UbiA family prenyltransferase [candidate division Zixibacteria bacterium]|nr:UbiA family prenyltransferase [candidate division Zixibacteria bacterium]
MFRTRKLGRKLFGPSFDYILFLRPRQWPILTFQLMVGIFAAPSVAAAISRGSFETFAWNGLVMAWLAWVVCLNGGTLAFNSAYDRDEKDIAYLVKPPTPPHHLATFSFMLMVIGAGLAFLVTPAFGLVTGGCVIMSVLYSHYAFRWKSIPGGDLAVNMVGYGGCTTLSGIMVGQAVLGAISVNPDPAGWLLIVGFCLLFGSFYPLTQIYQMDTDRNRGDLTLVAAIGTGKALTLAIVLGIAAAIFLTGATWLWNDDLRLMLPLLAALIIWTVMLAVWLRESARMDAAAHEKGMYIALTVWAVIDLSVLISRFGFML